MSRAEAKKEAARLVSLAQKAIIQTCSVKVDPSTAGLPVCMAALEAHICQLIDKVDGT